MVNDDFGGSPMVRSKPPYVYLESTDLPGARGSCQVFAYMWNAGARCWDKVGEVMGAPKPTQVLMAQRGEWSQLMVEQVITS